MNRATKDLIHALRNDPYTRTHFNMGDWIQPCGTVGCIAGTVLMRERNLTVRNHRVFLGGREDFSFSEEAAEVLELPIQIAQHLFLPDRWQINLIEDSFITELEPLWRAHPNWRCDLTTVERMKEWALGWKDPFAATPTQAANAIEALDDHPGYVDWMEAVG